MAVIAMVFLGSCTANKLVPAGKRLYTGADVVLREREPIKNGSDLKSELEELARPEPNDRILGYSRPKLWIYYKLTPKKGQKTFKERKKKDGAVIKKPTTKLKLRERFGQAPVYFEDVDIIKNETIIKNRLLNTGYFQAQVISTETPKGKSEMRVTYEATVHPPYQIGTILYPDVSEGTIAQIIRENLRKPAIKGNTQYRIDDLLAERERLSTVLRNQGYFHFSPDFLLWQADSAQANRTLNLRLVLKKDIDPNDLRYFTLNKVIVNPNFSLTGDSTSLANSSDTAEVGQFFFVNTPTNHFKPKGVLRNVVLFPGEPYSDKMYGQTLSSLISMNTFSFVNVRFIEFDTAGARGKLNTYVNLTPLKRRTIVGQGVIRSKSNNFAGPGLTTTVRNRNLLGGAELLNVTLNTSFETQIGGKNNNGLNSYEVGGDVELDLPRFLLPYRQSSRALARRNSQHTSLRLGVQQLNRVQYYRLNTINASYGLRWNESREKTHELRPVNLAYFRLGNTSPEFEAILDSNPFLRRSYEQQFIVGSTYTFTFNNQVNADAKVNHVFTGTLDVSGNILDVIQNGIEGRRPTPDNPHLLFGEAYSQYSRVNGEYRWSNSLNREGTAKLVARVIGGVGNGYGNSVTLPFVKQFFIGGNNSLRAFQPRALGPGRYIIPDSVKKQGQFFVDQAGDIKIEGNIEYRFDLISIMKGAFFVDAGNIWLARKNEAKPGGEFESSRFLSEIAVGTGFGLRFDASIVVLRLDLATPLRRPDLEGGPAWVLRDINWSRNWRRDNLVLNIAIGYPF